MKTHVIITIPGGHYPITGEQNKALMQKNMDEEVIIDGCTIKLRYISEVMTTQKYYETYPNKRPAPTDNFKGLTGMGFNGIIKRSPDAARQGMIKGMKKFLSDKKPGENSHAEDFLAKMELKPKSE
jgi:hypothetical protein